MAIPKAIGAAAAKGASKTDSTVLIIGAVLALFLLKKSVTFGTEKIGAAVGATKEYTGDFWKTALGAPRYEYAEDQSGSPNPPTKTWWEAPIDEGPVIVTDGTAVPTSPIMDAPVNPMDAGARHGEATNNWFTNPWFYPYFALAEKVVKDGSKTKNSDIFQ